jgi:hypothetical protein
MDTTTMTNAHQTSALSLSRSRAARLAPSAQARHLRVTAGRVWLTRSGAGPEGEDVWLSAGESLCLPAGTEWVAEGWPEARAELTGGAPTKPAFAWFAAWPKLLSAS